MHVRHREQFDGRAQSIEDFFDNRRWADAHPLRQHLDKTNVVSAQEQHNSRLVVIYMNIRHAHNQYNDTFAIRLTRYHGYARNATHELKSCRQALLALRRY